MLNFNGFWGVYREVVRGSATSKYFKIRKTRARARSELLAFVARTLALLLSCYPVSTIYTAAGAA